MAFAAALALLVAAPAVLLASATSLTAPSSTSGVSGRRFSGERLREVPELRFTGWRSRWQERCERWIVVTSIFAPSEATRSLGAMTKQGWCFVVVADQNGPQDYDVEGVIYLTVERQKALHFHIMDYLPWRHFGRKNVGFLFAIAHGAKVIYDTDDDNRLKEPRIPILGDELAANVSWPEGDPGGPGLMNPYPSFQPSCGHMWPRGFPLDYVQAQENGDERAEANGKDSLLESTMVFPCDRGYRRQSRAISYDSSDPELSSDSSDPEVGYSPKRSRRRRAMEVQRLRSEAAEQNISTFWRWWSRLVTSPVCSALVMLLVLVVCILALTGSTAIHLDRSQGTMDFRMLGPEDSQTLETLERVGKDFSEGIMGPTTLMFVARNSAEGGLFQPPVWDSMSFMLDFIHEDLLQNGALGSIASPMYLSSPEKMVKVKLDSALLAEHTTVGPATPVQLQELKYTMEQMLNAQRTAALALVTPNLRLTSPEATEWTRQLQKIVETQNAKIDSPIHVYMVSQNLQMLDVEEGVLSSVPNLILFSLVGCLVMIGLIFRSVMIAVRGLVTIVFTLAVVYMAAHGVFQLGWLRTLGLPLGGTEGLFFMAPVTAFTIVLGLALDYDIFLLGRMSELRDRGLPTMEAVADGVAQTGHVITCAGLMMAIAFGGMLLSDVPGMRQLSFFFTLGVLLDTFVVRTIVTPALTAALGEANWWPREWKNYD